MASSSRDLTQGSISKALYSLVAPMIFGIIAVISVSIIDTYFVAKLGTDELTALSFTFPVTMAVASIAIGLGAGAASVVSRAVGAGNTEDAKRLTTDSLVLAILVISALAVVGFFGVRAVFALMGAEENVLDLIVRYMRIWFVAMPFLIIPMIANASLRAIGEVLWPGIIMTGSAFLNMMLTPLFIFGWGPVPAFGIEGAAYGTFIAQLLTTVFVIWLLAAREKMIAWVRPPLDVLVNSWKRIISVGIPAALGNAVNPIGVAVVTTILASFGDPTVAAFGVATRIEAFAAIPMLALSASIGPISGQSWGKGNIGRVIEALKLSYWACFIWTIIVAAVLALFAENLVSLFASEASVIAEATRYLKIVPLTLWGYGVVIVAAGCYNSLGKSVSGLGFYLMRTALLYVPLSILASLIAGSEAVYVAISVSNALAGLICMVLSLRWLKLQNETLNEAAA